MEDYKGSHVLLFDLNDSQASSSSSSFSVGRASLCSDQEDGSNKVKSHMDKSKWKDHQAKEDHPQLQVDDRDHEDEAYKWMPSKMRILRKMMMSSCQESSQKFEDQKQFPSTTTVNHPNPSRRAGYKDLINDSVRVCADCNTTKTPLWRSGPRGPKSLCNACGIRQRKARRAMAAAAAAANGTILAVSTPPPLKIKLKHKKKRSKGLLLRDDKKTRKASSSPKSSLAPSKKDALVGFDFEDFTSKVLSKHYYAKVFPQDEKEAAILLMALSCGIVCN